MADPLTLWALSFLLQQAAAPHPPNPYAPQGSTLPEVSEAALHCYHPSARFQGAQLLESPWSGAEQWRADRSSVIAIGFTGWTGRPHVMTIALIERSGALRGLVLADDALVPRSANCSLDQWQQAELPPPAAEDERVDPVVVGPEPHGKNEAN